MRPRVSRDGHLRTLCRESGNEVEDGHGKSDTGKAGSFVRHLDELLRETPNLLAVLYMRMSATEQRKHGNLVNRFRWLKRELDRAGIPRSDESYREVCSGKFLRDRPRLIAAIEAARKLQSDYPDSRVVVVTDTRNRFLRGRYYNGYASVDPPNVRQWERLKKLAGTVTLATVLHPDTSFGEVRSHEDKVAQEGGKKVGRPRKEARVPPGFKKRKREELLPEAHRLHEEGLSPRKIGRLLVVKHRTVVDWLKRSQA
jgi:hypothetical protein